MAITKIQSESVNLADDFAFTGTVTGAGGTNTPAFQAVQSADVSISGSTSTLIPFNSETYDSNNLFNPSTGKFTMDSSNAGKYFIYAKITIDSDSTYGTSGNYFGIELRHYNSSDSLVNQHQWRTTWSTVFYPSAAVSGIFNLSNGDYVVPYAKLTGSGHVVIGVNTTSTDYNEFTGFKLIT